MNERIIRLLPHTMPPLLVGSEGAEYFLTIHIHICVNDDKQMCTEKAPTSAGLDMGIYSLWEKTSVVKFYGRKYANLYFFYASKCKRADEPRDGRWL